MQARRAVIFQTFAASLAAATGLAAAPVCAATRGLPLVRDDRRRRALRELGLTPAAFRSLSGARAIRPDALRAAFDAMSVHANQVRPSGHMVIVDLKAHSSKRRMSVIDLRTGTVETMLVAHGRGSDPEHDGYARRFSNTPNSKMSALGAYVTGATYVGRHGLSLRMDGLDPSNNKARERAIVMHGADYVAPGRKRIGRSWGCPAIERHHAKRLIPLLAGGCFLYITA